MNAFYVLLCIAIVVFVIFDVIRRLGPEWKKKKKDKMPSRLPDDDEDDNDDAMYTHV